MLFAQVRQFLRLRTAQGETNLSMAAGVAHTHVVPCLLISLSLRTKRVRPSPSATSKYSSASSVSRSTTTPCRYHTLPLHQFTRRCHLYAGHPPHKQAVLCRTQITLHATRRTPSRSFALGGSNVCLVGTNRRAPSRHCKDSRVPF